MATARNCCQWEFPPATKIFSILSDFSGYSTGGSRVSPMGAEGWSARGLPEFGGENQLFDKIFVENCKKMKVNWTSPAPHSTNAFDRV